MLGMEVIEMDEIFNELKGLFSDNPNVEISQDGSTIKFSTVFVDTLTAGLERNKKCYSYEIVLNGDNTYTACDRLRTFSGETADVSISERMGCFNVKGFQMGIGKDFKTGDLAFSEAWSSDEIKKPIDDYLSSLGLKKVLPKGILSGKQLAKIFAISWGIVILIVILLLMVL